MTNWKQSDVNDMVGITLDNQKDLISLSVNGYKYKTSVKWYKKCKS